jgi:hypothetical protein
MGFFALLRRFCGSGPGSVAASELSGGGLEVGAPRAAEEAEPSTTRWWSIDPLRRYGRGRTVAAYSHRSGLRGQGTDQFRKAGV